MKKKKFIKKLVGAIMIIVSLIVSAIPTQNVAATEGQTSDFKLDGNTLVKYTGTAEAVSVPNTVKVIGEEAFADNAFMESISLPEGLTKISYAAFAGCNNLQKISIPDSVTEIETAAFSNCSKLNEVTVGSGLRKLGNGVFVGCPRLKFVAFTGNDYRYVCDDGIIYDREYKKIIETLRGADIKSYKMPDSVEYIAPYAFYGCKQVEDVVLSNNISEISSFAFSNCYGLKNVTIPYSVNSIDMKAFENCVNLYDVDIPASVTNIHDTAFDGCANLNIVSPINSYPYKWFQNFDNSNVAIIDMEDNEIYEDDDSDDSDASNDGDNSDDSDASNDGDNSDDSDASNDGDNSDDSDDSGDGDAASSSGTDANSDNTNAQTSSGLTVDSGVKLGETKIVGRKAVFFINNTSQSVTSGKKTDGNNGNAGNENSANSSDGNGSNSNADNANTTGSQNEYSNLVDEAIDVLQTETKGKGLNLPKFARIGTRLATKAFYADSTLKVYSVDDDITEIGDFALARSSLTNVKLPEGVIKIGYGAFYHCDDLKTIVVPNTVTEIEPYAFEYTRMLDNWRDYGETDFLIMGDGVLVAYKGTASTVVVPEGVKYIAGNAFAGHNGIVEVYLPDSLITIGEEAFAGCSNMKYLSGGMNVEQIKDRAFEGCPIETTRIVASVKELGAGAFDYSDTKMEIAKRVVVFHGSQIPKLSYGKTTTRLTNESYRKDALSGIGVAIVGNGNVVLEDTVLDRACSGFSGLICTISGENDDYLNGTLNIIGCTLTADEAQKLDIPKTMLIYGKGYNFDLTQLNEVMEAARSGAYEIAADANGDSLTDGEDAAGAEDDGSNGEAQDANGGADDSAQLTELGDGNAFPKNVNSFVGVSHEYSWQCKWDSNPNQDVKSAYIRIYGDSIPANFTTFELCVTDDSTNVPISKFGKQSLEVSVALPSNMPTTNLHIICVDEDGQLEDLPYEVCADGDKLAVKFETVHSGNFGMYSFANTSSITGENADDTPDTGDMIHPKWFLFTALFFGGLALLLMKDGKKFRV